MKTKKEKIIEIYENELQHPSYGYIARKVGCGKTYAWEVVQAHLKDKKAT